MAALLSDHVVHLLIGVPSALGVLYSIFAWMSVASVKMEGPGGDDKSKPLVDDEEGPLSEAKIKAIVNEMQRLAKIIANGAKDFLFAEYLYIGVFILFFAVFLVFFVDVPTTVAFLIGALTSIICGFIGMEIAVYTNVRTAHECWKSLGQGFDVAVKGGCVMGLSLVAIGVLVLQGIILVFPIVFKSHFEGDQQKMYEAIAGYGLGGSCIALFGRVGGGIYTKAADVGADLAGKISEDLAEDDPRNPACIADNVGDNVGDIAGMGADLFGSFAESTCAALVLAASSDLKEHFCSLMYPVLISSTGIVIGIVTLLMQKLFVKVNADNDVEKALKAILVISTVLMSPVVYFLSVYCLPPVFSMGKGFEEVHREYCALSVILGLWSGLIIGFVTEYYTSNTYEPVRKIAEQQKRSAATGVIYGLALGYLSCIVPVLCLGITILIAHSFCGMFGVALGALGMLGTMSLALTIDAYGPISDNAGGIAEMAGMPGKVRTLTDKLDAAGNTTAAIGKGFAIGSAALVSLALFGAFTVRAGVTNVDILDPWVFTGLLFGAMMPYAFAAWTMESVGKAADEMFQECVRQFPGILSGQKEPDYKTCIKISTEASVREMIAPGALVIFSPLVAGLGFGKNACAGLLSGALVSSVQLAISMSNTGGAWDNSKKYISGNGLAFDPPKPKLKDASKGVHDTGNWEHVKDADGNDTKAVVPDLDGDKEQPGPFSTMHKKDKSSLYNTAHQNSVIGDTVGDPLKDTSGPALNIVMKLTAILSLVFGTAIASHSNAQGGPSWLHVAKASTVV